TNGLSVTHVLLHASVRRHRRTLRGCLWPYGGWIGFRAAAPCSLRNGRHPRPVSAYRPSAVPPGPSPGHQQPTPTVTRGALTRYAKETRRPVGPLRGPPALEVNTPRRRPRAVPGWGRPPMDSTSATLLERLHDRNDAAAWERLVDLYTPLIRSWLRRHGAPEGEADDLAQEVLKAVVCHLPAFRHSGRTGAFRSWLRTIAVNQVRQSWRSGRGRPGSAGLAAALDQLADPASDL